MKLVFTFDYKPRRVGRGVLKLPILLPFPGAAGVVTRLAQYLPFFGFHKRPFHVGYDTVSVDFVRRSAGAAHASAVNSEAFSVAIRRLLATYESSELALLNAPRSGKSGAP
jgi:hypothetical protein